MNEPVVTMESILESVAQPVWVVDHDRNAADGGGQRVEVGDDGVGGAQAAGGSGLRGLGDRIGALDGTLEVRSPPGRGTLLRARIPLVP